MIRSICFFVEWVIVPLLWVAIIVGLYHSLENGYGFSGGGQAYEMR